MSEVEETWDPLRVPGGGGGLTPRKDLWGGQAEPTQVSVTIRDCAIYLCRIFAVGHIVKKICEWKECCAGPVTHPQAFPNSYKSPSLGFGLPHHSRRAKPWIGGHISIRHVIIIGDGISDVLKPSTRRYAPLMIGFSPTRKSGCDASRKEKGPATLGRSMRR